ncbi:hypothetical protein [Frigidibacter sp. ROC022]|uniref:hypothetical protein n=1 Tax=Frigidibacter sp. ROC022 TaxID=2971796 RepID=UPI00215AC588|nr:hypothetical protein [Frigidibacter sp. ROC022]MCR8724529.1 hypothetical protein [Frigidibacter sp. ROC022]
MRSYTQTTGLWVRAILQSDYGVDPASVSWLCFDRPHLQEDTNPDFVTWGEEGKDPVGMLLDGELDATMLDITMPKDPRVKTLIPNPQHAALQWYAREGLVPSNHYVIVPDALCEQRPDVVREVWRMLVESRREVRPEGGVDEWPVDDLFHPLVREIAT